MSEPARYRKRPVEIEAIQWDGTALGAASIVGWITGNGMTATYLCADPDRCGEFEGDAPHAIKIATLEGAMTASLDDWIIRGVQGEFYPCKPDIFTATYEPVAPSPAAESPRTFPDDSDVITLGDGIFASDDGEIINWRGENYTRQPGAGPSVPADDDLRTRIRGVIRDCPAQYPDDIADAVLAVLPAPADRAAVLREAADALDASDRLRDLTDDHMNDVNAAANELRRMADEAQQAETVSLAYARLQAAAKEATEAAHLHAMHGIKRAFKLARQYGNQSIPPAEVLNALGLDENANTVKSVAPAPVPDPTWPRRAWDLGLLHTGGDPHHCPACLAQPEPPADFVCPSDNEAVLANPQPAVEAQQAEVVHGCPPDGSGLTPCCGRTPFELPLTDRISSEAPTTCPGAVEARQADTAREA